MISVFWRARSQGWWQGRRHGARLGRLAGLAVAVWCLGTAIAAASPLFSKGRSAPETPGQVRLFPAGRDEASGRYRAVVEIALTDGYKTYWRESGDSGVPTTFDWAGSGNVADVQVRYPAPERFFDGSGHAIGYLRTVRFPLEVAPAAAGRPVELSLDVDFGVCREICIPERVTVAATLSDVVQIAGLWEDAVALLPAAVQPGETAEAVGVADARLDGDSLRLAITGDVGQGGDVFVEGPPGWQFGRPLREASSTPAGGAVFTVPARRPADAGPAELTVTVIGGARPVETRVRVGAP